MRPVTFPGAELLTGQSDSPEDAKDHPPIYFDQAACEGNGIIVTCWEANAEEAETFAKTRRVFLLTKGTNLPLSQLQVVRNVQLAPGAQPTPPWTLREKTLLTKNRNLVEAVKEHKAKVEELLSLAQTKLESLDASLAHERKVNAELRAELVRLAEQA